MDTILIITPEEKDLGEFSVKRSLPYNARKMVGPWIFFDHFGPAQFAAGEGIDVRPHPHIGLATVSYLFEGEILHRDSLGSVQTIRPGAINLMVAGRGIVHSERTGPQIRARGHVLHGLQLWLALPDEKQEIEPAFHHYPPEEIPAISKNGVYLRVIIGEAYDMISPVKTFSPTLYVEARLEKDASLKLPQIAELAIYVVTGELEYLGNTVHSGKMLVIDSPLEQFMQARTNTHIVIIGGAPVGERVIWWNFVSNNKERMEKAKLLWQKQAFSQVPEETEFIPLPK